MIPSGLTVLAGPTSALTGEPSTTPVAAPRQGVDDFRPVLDAAELSLVRPG
uniref:hypothetical protein n=1 Tax=Amycolatopsis rhabdoformis TaxID=1448059 RepID=UPI003898D894